MTTDDGLHEFDSFDHDDAWRLGCRIVEHCRAAELPVVISIHLGEQRVFHAGLAGSNASNDSWVDRKRNIVRRFDRSSLAVYERYVTKLGEAFYQVFGIPQDQFAAGEGAVPIRVNGAQVGVLSLSGIEPAGDHEIVVRALNGEL